MTLPVLYDRNILIGQFCEGSGATKYQMSLKTHLIFATTHLRLWTGMKPEQYFNRKEMTLITVVCTCACRIMTAYLTSPI